MEEIMGKTFQIAGNDISDGYHTFNELYEHRVYLFLALIVALDGEFKVLYKPDHFEGWDCVYIELDNKQMSYHIPNKHRAFLETHAQLVCDKYKWNGHNPNDVIEILKSYVARNTSSFNSDLEDMEKL